MKRVLKIAMVVSVLALSTFLLFACKSSSSDNTAASPGVVRTYYIAADEVDWDYAPQGNIIGSSFDEHAAVYLTNVPFDLTGLVSGGTPTLTLARIGSKYKKALYREYTDATFATLKPVPDQWKHLGTLGPVIRAEVGDTIKVVFKNNAQFGFSVHPHGVFYNKDSEGAPYNDGTSGADKLDDAVPPGGTHTYTWEVPERAGPGPMDPSSIGWMYHSHTDETKDTYSGLIGPMIISRKGATKADGTPTDVDREFFTLFHVFSENTSKYLDQNVAAFAKVTDPADIATLEADPDFQESNQMHSINGYSFGNLTTLTMKKGERVRWYVMGMGTEVDIHTPHWHGNTVTVNGMRADVVSVFPATMVTADMEPDNAGTWLFHCHVNDHIDAGMITTYTVTE